MENVLSWVRSIISTTPARWTSLTDSLPTDLLVRAPLPGEWSAVECLQHILDTEQVFPFRIKALLAGQDFPAFNPAEDGTQGPVAPSPKALAQEFARRRAANLVIFDSVGEADLDRKARHSELGIVTMNQLLHEWAAHDLNHTVQAERALMQPFLHGCGPWITYFTDHIAKSK